jgi:hydrogenase maturation protease
MKILVACIGNIFQGDDAFGCEVARSLTKRLPPSDDIRLVDFGIRGLDLTFALLDAPELTILVDTAMRGATPGTLYTIEPDLEDLSAYPLEAHAMDPVQVLRAVKSLGGKLGRILLVACEPAELGGDQGLMGLSPAVAAAVERAADIVQTLIAKEGLKVQVPV